MPMARTVAQLPKGSRMTDPISRGVMAKSFPLAKIHQVLIETGMASRRQRDLPRHVVIYHIIALALSRQVSCREVLRCLLEGLRGLSGGRVAIHGAGKSGISQARERVGVEPPRRLHDQWVAPIAAQGARALSRRRVLSRW